MSRKLIRVLIASFVLALLAGVMIFRFYGIAHQPDLVIAPVWSKYSRELKSILDEVLELDLEMNEVLLSEQNSPDRQNQELLFIYTWGNTELSAISDDFIDLTNPSLDLLPRVQRRIGQTSKGQIALPLVLDHVELAFRRDFFANEGFMVEDRIETLEQVEQVWLSLKSESFFPLMVAGKEIQDFLDLVSVLALSQGGYNSYTVLYTELQTSNQASGNLEEFLSPESQALLDSVGQRLIFWRSEGILHPDWINFSTADVLRFVETRLTSSVVMRLSTHRNLTPQQLRFWQSSAFPFTVEQNALRSGGLIAPAMVISARIDQPGSEAVLERLPRLLEAALQDRLGRLTGLAPVNSTAHTIDREADDLRYWAASSGRVLPSIADILISERVDELILVLRTQLGKSE